MEVDEMADMMMDMEEYLEYLEYLELGQSRNFCNVFNLELLI